VTRMRGDEDTGPPTTDQPSRRTPAAKTALDLLAELLEEIRGLRGDMRIERRAANRREHGPTLAPERELSGKRANEPIQYPPKSMPQLTGKRPRDLSVELLDRWAEACDELADFYDRKGAVDPKGNAKSHWPLQDAALARGLAAKKRREAATSAPAAAPAPPAPARAPIEPPEGAGDAWEPPAAPAAPGADDEDDNDDPYT